MVSSATLYILEITGDDRSVRFTAAPPVFHWCVPGVNVFTICPRLNTCHKLGRPFTNVHHFLPSPSLFPTMAHINPFHHCRSALFHCVVTRFSLLGL